MYSNLERNTITIILIFIILQLATPPQLRRRRRRRRRPPCCRSKRRRTRRRRAVRITSGGRGQHQATFTPGPPHRVRDVLGLGPGMRAVGIPRTRFIMERTAAVPMIRPAFDGGVAAGDAPLVDAPEKSVGCSSGGHVPWDPDGIYRRR